MEAEDRALEQELESGEEERRRRGRQELGGLMRALEDSECKGSRCAVARAQPLFLDHAGEFNTARST